MIIPDSIYVEGTSFSNANAQREQLLFLQSRTRSRRVSIRKTIGKKKRKRKGEREKKKKKRTRRGFSQNMLLQREYIAFLLRALSTAFRPTFSKLRPAKHYLGCITFRVSRCFLFRQIKIKLTIITYRFLRITQRGNNSFLTKPRLKTLFLAERTKRGYTRLSDVNNTRFFLFLRI